MKLVQTILYILIYLKEIYIDLKLCSFTGASITKKWYNIRDSYAKSRRSGASKRCRPYIYADMLSFLDPIYHLEDKDDNSFKIDETPESEHFETEACYFEVDENDDAKRPKFDTDGSKRDDDIVAVLANLIQREEDEDRSFLKSLTPAVKSLSETSKLEFKIGVLSLLKKLKQKDAPVQIKIESMTKNSDSE